MQMKKAKKITAITLVFLFGLYNIPYWIEKLHHQMEDELIRKAKIEAPDNEGFDKEQNVWLLNRKCLSKKISVAFLKTHKTGSSTVTSILNRFTDLNNLDIAIPSGDTRFGWPGPFKVRAVDRTRLKHKRANVLCNHSVLDRKELLKVMKPGFRLITILRNPVDQIYSLFHYENFTRLYEMQYSEDPVETFFKNTSRYYHTFKSRMNTELLQLENLLKNGMTFDLNFKRFQKQQEKNTFKDFISYLDKAVHLVMITDMFDESLILLKNLMCWNFMDLVYQKKLVNHALHTGEKKRPKELVERIEQWSSLDQQIYTHFKHKLENLIAKHNAVQFQEDLFRLQTLNTYVSQFCANMTEDNKLDVWNFLQEIREDPPSEFVNKPACFCRKMARSENRYISYFRHKFPPFYFFSRLQRQKAVPNGC